ncbi:MAG: chorismate synthase [Pseudomonadota bacterium]
MPGNSFGRSLTITTFGESHGPALGCIVDGVPPGLELDEQDMMADIERRRSGTSRFTSQRREPDRVEILSGLFEGRTTGTPIGLVVRNVDQRSKDYTKIMNQFRPGHADYTYLHKYGVRDYRGGGRSSARETVMRVAAGAIARKYLREHFSIQIYGWLGSLGPVELDLIDRHTVDDNPFFCADPSRVEELEVFMRALHKSGDSAGARVNVVAERVPVGLGEPVFNKLDADIASAMMGVNAAKGVEIGAGFRSVFQKGTEHRDELTPDGFLSNEAGGVLGGISTGQDLRVSVAFKPTSSLRLPGRSIDTAGEPIEIVTHGRHDPCVGIRAVPICEAMLALVIMDHVLLQRAQNAEATCTSPDIEARRGGAKTDE